MKPAEPQMRHTSFILGLSMLVAGQTLASASAPLHTTGQGERIALARLPLHFEANCGQTDASVKFLTRGRGCSLFLAPDEVVLSLSATGARSQLDPVSLIEQSAPRAPSAAHSSTRPLRMRLVGGKASPRLIGLDELAGQVNYFKGNDPSKWCTNIATYAKVRYENVYPGIDLVFYGSNEQQLEFDFIVATGANPNLIKLVFEGVDKIETDADGNLRLLLVGEEILLHKPRLYQMSADRREEIAGEYRLREVSRWCREWEVGFHIAAYDPARPLVIDPVLSYSTYLGGIGIDAVTGVAVDAQGRAYVVGWTDSPDFPAAGVVGATGRTGSRDAFVTKLDADGSGLIYSTFLGGFDGAGCRGIAVDSDGNAYITGSTGDGFPVINGCQASAGGWIDAFVMKLNSTGSAILYSTYLGGTGAEWGIGIAADGAGNAFVTGSTSSTNLPTSNALQATFGGGGTNNPDNYKGDVFVAKLDTTAMGSASLLYSTYLGGSEDEAPVGIALDPADNAYVTGRTASTNFPTSNALQPNFGGGSQDAFVAKINPSGSALVYSTYLGGSGYEDYFGGGIAVDVDGCAYVAGDTGSTDFPTTRDAYHFSREGYAIYLSKLSKDGSSLVYSARLAGSHCYGVAVDTAGSAWVVGDASTVFALVNPIPIQLRWRLPRRLHSQSRPRWRSGDLFELFGWWCGRSSHLNRG